MNNKEYFEAYSVGICYASVCTDLPLNEATNRLNAEHMTGIQSQWKPSEDETWANGSPQPCECEDDPTRKHYLFDC